MKYEREQEHCADVANEFIQVEERGDEDGRNQRASKAGGKCTGGEEIRGERMKESERRKADPEVKGNESHWRWTRKKKHRLCYEHIVLCP